MTAQERDPVRIGIDLGGTKIAGIALKPDESVAAELRIATPREDYAATLEAVHQLVLQLERAAGAQGVVGLGMPGSVSPVTGLVQNANSTWLNGRPFDRDLARHLGRPLKVANDANCFALSEATDGAAAGARAVFGVILGTGCGGGVVLEGKLVVGPRAIAGEWGHNPLPWPQPDELPGPRCWCGRFGCIESWVSGPGLSADYARATGECLTPAEIAVAAARGVKSAEQALERHASRLARGLAHVINIFDPEVIVLGGGLSQLEHLYEQLPGLIAPHVFAAKASVEILRPRWGDASGVRGAAWLWGRGCKGLSGATSWRGDRTWADQSGPGP